MPTPIDISDISVSPRAARLRTARFSRRSASHTRLVEGAAQPYTLVRSLWLAVVGRLWR
jgi:hypothetical protein